jgi:hypothetical protein
MRAIVFLIMAGLGLILVASSASASPIFQYNCISASGQGLEHYCPLKSFVSSLDTFTDDKINPYFPTVNGKEVHAVEPRMVLAGIWIPQSIDVNVLQEHGREFENLLISLFVGSLLIGLSGFIRMFGKKQQIILHEKAPMKARVSYEKTLWAESNGLL